jgi:hypothetical protein
VRSGVNRWYNEAVSSDHAPGRAPSSQLALLAAAVSASPAETDQAEIHARLARLRPTEIDSLARLAEAHGVSAWLAHRVPPDIESWQRVSDQRAIYMGAYTRNIVAIRGLVATMTRAGLPWVLLKGIALAQQFYPRPDMRFGVDIDVLVAPERFGDAIEAMTDAGWTLVDRNWTLAAQTVPAELRLVSPHGIIVDLHWHLLAEVALRRQFTFSTGELLDRRRILPSGIPVLDPAAQLAHLGVHGALSGANRLLWLHDASLAAAQVSDWTGIAAVAHASGTSAALTLVLLRAQRWFGPVIPAEAWRLLGAGWGWRLTCTAIDRISPLRSEPLRPAVARSFARSVRPRASATTVEFTRHAASFVGAGAHRAASTSPLKNPDDPRSPMFAADDPRARASYFAAILD